MSVSRHQSKWRAEIWLKGKRVWSGSGYETELEARNAEAEAKENIATINMDFLRLSESRLEELELKRSKSHFLENKAFFKKLTPLWGRKKKITRDDVEAYLNEVALESKSKANKHLRFIRALFSHGVKRGWLKHNPCTGIERFPEKKKKKYIPSEEDIRLVLELANCEQRRYLLVVAHTLGRIRAINNLRWEDVHENYLSLFTRKAKNSDEKEIRVPMNSVLKAILEDMKKHKTGEYVFLNPQTGRPYDYRDKFLPNLCKEAGVEPFMYHSLRHWGASKLDSMGVGLTTIKEILGHERTSTTDLYLQSLRGGVTDAMEKLGGLK